MAKLPCPPSCQAASDKFVKLRIACDEVEVLALEAMTAARVAITDMLKLAPTMLVMDSGPMEEKIYSLAATGAKGRSMHRLGSKLMRSNNFELPVPGAYGPDNRPESVAVKVKMPRRR